MSFFLLLNTKEDILKNVGNQTVMVPVDVHSIFFPFSYYGSQTSVWLPILIKTTSFVFSIRNSYRFGLEHYLNFKCLSSKTVKRVLFYFFTLRPIGFI